MTQNTHYSSRGPGALGSEPIGSGLQLPKTPAPGVYEELTSSGT